MKQILKKIDEMKKLAEKLLAKEPHDKHDEIQNDISTGYITACDEFKEFILSLQKEPCCSQSDCEYKVDGNCTMQRPCPHQRKPLTIGDKIRESNESLSAFIRGQFGDNRVFHNGAKMDLDEFLNQPIDQSIQ